MLVRTVKRLGYTLLPGSILLQSCAVSDEELQNAAASGLELFFTDLFATALSQWINQTFNLT